MIRFWEPVTANGELNEFKFMCFLFPILCLPIQGCPHASYLNQDINDVHLPYWRGCSMAQLSIWQDYCILRQNASDDDIIVIFEDDFYCVANNCAPYLDYVIQHQSVDLFYLGYCYLYFKAPNAIPPNCLHAYSIKCKAVRKIRDMVDPCGRGMDQQLSHLGSKGWVFTWDYMSDSDYTLNVTSYDYVANSKYLGFSYDDSSGGMFRQVMNRTNYLEKEKNRKSMGLIPSNIPKRDTLR